MAFRYLIPTQSRGLRPTGGSSGGSLFDLHRQMNSLFDDLFDSNRQAGDGQAGSSSPAMDVHQENGRIEITAELPGVREDDIDLTVEDGVLILSGEKKSQRENGANGYRERSYGRFERRITLPQAIDENAIEAEFEHGVLTITLPLAERQLGRKIPLGAKRGNSQSNGNQANGFAGGAGNDAENALVDADSSRVGGPGGEGGDHRTPGAPSDSSAAMRANQQG